MRWNDCIKSVYFSLVSCIRNPEDRSKTQIDPPKKDENSNSLKYENNPYRDPTRIQLDKWMSSEGLFYKITTSRFWNQNDLLVVKNKSHRRAIRHFNGKEIRHRVVNKNESEISFDFHRNNMSYERKINIVWRKKISAVST